MSESTALYAESEKHWIIPELLSGPAPEPSYQEDRAVRRFLPVLVSAGLHAVVLTPLLLFRTPPPSVLPRVDPVFVVHLRQELTPVPPPESAIQNSAVPQAPQTPAPVLPQIAVPIVEAVRPQPTPAPEPEPEPERVPAPSRLEIRQLVEQMPDARGDVSAMQVCTPTQQHSPMFDCPETHSGFPDTGTAGSFVFNDLLNGNNSLRLQRRDRLKASLEANGLGGREIDEYLEAIDVNLQELSTSGDAKAQQMRDQIYRNDATYQWMQRVLNPP